MAVRPDAWLEELLAGTEWWTQEDDGTSVAAGAPTLTPADKSALWVRFSLADVVVRLGDSIRQIMSQPTLDFELQYQAGYEAFAQASAHLDQESRRVESAGPEFQPIVGNLRAVVERQRGSLAELFEDHADRHRRYREAMIPVTEQIAKDQEKASAQRFDRQREEYRKTNEDQAGAQRRRVQAFDDWNRQWLENQRR